MNLITLSNSKITAANLTNMFVANKEDVEKQILELRENGETVVANFAEHLLSEAPVVETHTGTMHADDVCSTAFLRLLNSNVKVSRVFKMSKNAFGYDIGGKENREFDHHDDPREERENGTIYAAFGKLWRAFAPILFSKFVVSYVDEVFCQPIDHTDNTGERNLLSTAIGLFNSTIVDEADYNNDAAFEQVVALVQTILQRVIIKAFAEEQAAEIVAPAAEKAEIPGILVLDTYVSWQYYLSKHPELGFKVVIAPSDRGGYGATIVEETGFRVPKTWWGLINPTTPPVEGLTFCHASNGFLTAFDTLENAVKAMKDLI